MRRYLPLLKIRYKGIYDDTILEIEKAIYGDAKVTSSPRVVSPEMTTYHDDVTSATSCTTSSIPNNGKVAIVNRVGYGQVMVATESILELDTIVFREKPILFWEVENWDELFDRYLNASKKIKKQVLAMFIPPEDSKARNDAAEYVKPCKKSFPRFKELGKDLAIQLISITIANAHSYMNSSFESVEQRMAGLLRFGKNQGDTTSALLPFGVHIRHSCLPNVFCFPRTSDGYLEFRVIRPIQMGDMICCSYVKEPFIMPTWLRRATLLRTQDIVCTCVRCMAPDYSRMRKCVKTSHCCNHYIPCTFDYQVTTATRINASQIIEFAGNNINEAHHKYVCSKCGILDNKGKAFFEELMYIEDISKLHSELDFTEATSKKLTSMHRRFKQELEQSNHYLILLMLQDLAFQLTGRSKETLFTAMTAGDEVGKETSYKQLLTAVKCGFICASKVECIAACCVKMDCPGCISTKPGEEVPPHPPVFENVMIVYTSWMNVKIFPKSQWPPYTIGMLRRYYRFLKMYFRNIRDDMEDIRALITE
jgi:SET domain